MLAVKSERRMVVRTSKDGDSAGYQSASRDQRRYYQACQPGQHQGNDYYAGEKGKADDVDAYSLWIR